MTILSIHPQRDNADFQLITRSFLMEKGLPLASVLPAAEIERIFRRHDALFGNTYNSVYNTAIVLWAFLSQVLADGKMRSCAAAVARVCDFLITVGKNPPSTDTGEYCHARKKLDEKALHDLVVEAAEKTEHAAAGDWLWHGRHAKLVDGFTATMPDTPENQREFPQQKSQKPGIGFPILRACVVLSLATACVIDGAFGPYSGKQTGEPALLRQLFGAFESGDVAVFDRCCVSYASSRRRLRAHAPTTFRRSASWPAARQARSTRHLAASRAAAMDGRSDLRDDPRNVCLADDPF